MSDREPTGMSDRNPISQFRIRRPVEGCLVTVENLAAVKEWLGWLWGDRIEPTVGNYFVIEGPRDGAHQLYDLTPERFTEMYESLLTPVEPPVLTPMSLSVAEEWPISSAPWLRVRRVGWLDQKGRVWTEIPASSEFDGGSLTPLLIQLEDKFEPPVLTNVQKAIDYLTGDHDLDTRQEVVGKTLEILRSAPPVLSRATWKAKIDALIENVAPIPHFAGQSIGLWQRRGAERLRDAILKSLSQKEKQ